MCGRYRLSGPKQLIIQEFGIANKFREIRIPFRPGFNLAPTHPVWTIRDEQHGRAACEMLWGLIPSWSKDVKAASRLINARGETVAEKPSFRSAFKARRCIIPANGYYEWKTEGKLKRPHDVHRPGDQLLAFAGLWETWRPLEGDPVETCTIITTSAAPAIAWLHDRMPAVLELKDYDQWLDPQNRNVEGLKTLIRPYAEPLDVDPVGQYVNNVRNQGPECLSPPQGER